jgi:CheY-like chemotaxis protein
LPARVLVVDDNPVVRKTLRNLLETGNHWDITEAEDGQAAIARALEVRPHVIILDLVMPVMDGLNAAREISQALPETAIVMYTMHWSSLLEVEAQKHGVRKLVSKTQSKVLLSTIRELISALPPEPAADVPQPAPPLSFPAEPAVTASPADKASAPTLDSPEPSDGKLAS